MRINEIEIRAYVVLTKVFVEFVQKKNIIGAEKLLDSMTRNQYFDFLDILTFKYGDKYSKLADKMWEKLEMNIGDKKTNEYKLVESRIAKIVKKVLSERRKLREDWDDEDSFDNEPQPEDIVISDGRGSKYEVGIVDGKHIGTFDDWDAAEAAVKKWMKRNNFYPTVWYQDDHGGVEVVTIN